MKLEEFNLIVAGVGGQGNIRAAKYLADVAIRCGKDVIVGETFGASQRGGSVRSHIRIGKNARSPQVPQKKCNVILGFEPLESLQCCLDYLEPNGVAIVNVQPVYSTEVKTGKKPYPSLDTLQDYFARITNRVLYLNATAAAEELGNTMVMNTIMLGALDATGVFPAPRGLLKEIVVAGSPKAFRELNEKAFDKGVELGQARLFS
ncbi:MAG: indolepyruvate oxidoreductase subunit beta [bacterium]